MRSSLRLALQLTKPSFSFCTSSNSTRPAPPPIRVAITHSAGRGVFATRRIGAGELIHTAKPAVCHPSPSAIHTVCYSCLTSLPNSQPQRLSFCSQHCKRHCKEYYDVEMKANWTAFDDYCRYECSQASKDWLLQL